MTVVAFPPAGLKLLGTLDRLGGPDHRAVVPSAYESLLRKPAIALALSMNRHLEQIAPEYGADPRRIGMAPGQVFRHDRHGVARRTEVAIEFRRRRSVAGSSAGFAVRIGATGIDVTAGMWRPARNAIVRWRSWLLLHHEELRAAMSGDVLRRMGPPQVRIGEQELTLDVRHPADMRVRLSMASELWWTVRLAPGLLTSPTLDRAVASYFRVLAPCVKMLSGAMGAG